MGSITKRAKVDKATGKTVTTYRAYVRREGFASKSKVCETEREARDWLRNNEADSALQRPTSGVRFDACVELFVKAPPTRGTRFWVAAHLDFWRTRLGALKATEIGRAEINAAKLTLLAMPSTRRIAGKTVVMSERITPTTVNRYLASLSSVFNFLQEAGVIDDHPMKAGKVKKLGESNQRTRVLTADEESRLMAAARSSEWPQMALLLRLALTCAARRSELLGLKWKDIRFDESIAVLDKTKNGRARSLPLVSDVKAALAAAAKVKPLGSDFVFFNERAPSERKNITTVWRKCREDAGLLNDREDPLDRVYLHTSRHTAITRMLKGGANLAQAATVSGHQTLSQLKRYEHLAASDSVELAQKHLAGGTGLDDGKEATPSASGG